MPKFIVDFWMDGYDSEKEMEAQCADCIFDALDSSGTSVKVVKVGDCKGCKYFKSLQDIAPHGKIEREMCVNVQPCVRKQTDDLFQKE